MRPVGIVNSGETLMVFTHCKYKITVFHAFIYSWIFSLALFGLGCDLAIPEIEEPPLMKEINNTGHFSKYIEERSNQYGLVPLRLEPNDSFELRVWSSVDETGIEKCLIYKKTSQGTTIELITPELKLGTDPPSFSEKIPLSRFYLSSSKDVLSGVEKLIKKYKMLASVSVTENTHFTPNLAVLDDPVITLEIMNSRKYSLMTAAGSESDTHSIEIENFCAELSELLEVNMGCRLR